MSKLLYVYIMTNRSGTLYTGLTNDMVRRYLEHLAAGDGTFAGRYKLTRVVYIEATSDWRAAIAREKQIKGWTRRKKIALVESVNREWRNLMDDVLEPQAPEPGPSPAPELRSGSGSE